MVTLPTRKQIGDRLSEFGLGWFTGGKKLLFIKDPDGHWSKARADYDPEENEYVVGSGDYEEGFDASGYSGSESMFGLPFGVAYSRYGSLSTLVSAKVAQQAGKGEVDVVAERTETGDLDIIAAEVELPKNAVVDLKWLDLFPPYQLSPQKANNIRANALASQVDPRNNDIGQQIMIFASGIILGALIVYLALNVGGEGGGEGISIGLQSMPLLLGGLF